MIRHPTARRRIVPTEIAALAAGVTQATIRKWASRGRLTRYGQPGRAQYDLDEVILIIGRAAPCRSVGEVAPGRSAGDVAPRREP